MQDRIILLSLAKLFELAMPADITATVVSVVGGVITLDVPTGDNHVWVGGALKFTSGNLDGISFAIADNKNDNIVVFVQKFTAYVMPVAGDTVILSGGPLKGGEVEIYVDDPDSIKVALEQVDAPRFFVCLNSVECAITFRALAGGSTSGEGVTKDVYSIDATVETKYLTGGTNSTDVKKIAYELPLLRDQILVLIFNYALNPGNRVQLVDGIHCGRVLINRPGMKNPTRGYIASCDFEVL